MKRTILVLVLLCAIAFSAFSSGMTLGVRSSILEVGPEVGWESGRFGLTASIGLPVQTTVYSLIDSGKWSEFDPLGLVSILHYRAGAYFKCVDTENISVNLGLMYAGYAIMNYKNPEPLRFFSYSASPTIRVLFKADSETETNNGFFIEGSTPFLGLLLAKNQKISGGAYAAEGNASEVLGGALITAFGLYLGCLNFGYTWSF